MPRQVENLLCYGDNLTMLRQHIADESIDLVYLDPPFNSDANYNMLFEERDGSRAAAQIQAFEDTWRWDAGAARAYAETIEQGGNTARALEALRTIVGDSDMLAYMSMMAPRLVELHRVLKRTGSLYLHCDPTASHYLKLLLDAVFSPGNFQGEIVWKRTNSRSTKGKWPRLHDTLLHYSKSDRFTFHAVTAPADEKKLPHTLITGPDGLKYQTYELTAPGLTKEGESGKPWRGKAPGQMGRHWANSHATMDRWDAEGLIHWPGRNGFPRRRDAEPFDAAARVVTVGDVWTDIDRLNQTAKERLGYPTQKPMGLLDRIILSGSNRGDTVLDPFCGCGTAVESAERLGRKWIGIDITNLAIALIKKRLGPDAQYAQIGAPTTAAEAAHLGKDDPHAFQDWVLGQLTAQPGQAKRGADRGIDGLLWFKDARSSKRQSVIISVKAGHVAVSHLRDLHGVVTREGAAIGALVCLEEPTRAMRQEVASAGFFQSQWGRHPKLQIVTIAELFAGKRIDYPHTEGADVTFKQPPKKRGARAIPQDLFAHDPLAGTALSRGRKQQSAAPTKAIRKRGSRKPSIRPVPAGRRQRKRSK